MRTALVLVAAAGVGAFVASWVMWWATKRSAVWSMAAAVLVFFVVSACALLMVWMLMNRAAHP